MHACPHRLWPRSDLDCCCFGPFSSAFDTAAAATAQGGGSTLAFPPNLCPQAAANAEVGSFASLFPLSFFLSLLPSFRPRRSRVASITAAAGAAAPRPSHHQPVLDYFRVHECRPSQICIIALVKLARATCWFRGSFISSQL